LYRLLLRVSIEELYKSKWVILNLVLERILIYYELKNNKKIKDLISDGKITFKSHYIESWCFQLKFKNKNYEKIGGISISVPPDVMRNRGNEYNEPEEPTTLETALVD
jgi:hypothetical protein